LLLERGFVGIGYSLDVDLSRVESKDALYDAYRRTHPDETSNLVMGQQVGQIARFLLELQPGDYVIMPGEGKDLHYGSLVEEAAYFHPGDDGCHYRHRRSVKWLGELRRDLLSVPFQNTMRSTLAVFAVNHRDEFMKLIGTPDPLPTRRYDPYSTVLEQVLQLTASEFELLVGHLLAALGFDDPEVIGKPGDGGVDAVGDLNASGLAVVKVHVQAKRYKLGARISAGTVKRLRASIPAGDQGAFITTAGFRDAAAGVAEQQGFPRIGLIDGRHLVDLLVEHWSDIPQEFQEKLGLKPGLVRA